jgi:hypothetical protein
MDLALDTFFGATVAWTSKAVNYVKFQDEANMERLYEYGRVATPANVVNVVIC